MGKKHLCFFETAEIGNRTPNSGVKGSGANHYPRAPAPCPDMFLVKSIQYDHSTAVFYVLNDLKMISNKLQHDLFKKDISYQRL